MQRKKKISGRNGSQELANSKVSRAQKKASESSQVLEKNASELIASSVRKHARAEVFPKKIVESKYCSLRDETAVACLALDATKDVSCKSYHHELSHAGSESIFSPSFHISKPSEADMPEGVPFIKFFQSGDQKFHRDSGLINANFDSVAGQQTSNLIIGQEMNLVDSTLASIGVKFSDDVYCNGLAELEGEALSSEVSAIYLAMKNSRLECVDEHDQNHLSTESYMQEDEDEDFDDFDPYFFIKNLPELTAVVPTYRSLLLPKQTRSCPPTTLVLDLDETLVHSTLEPCVDADFTFPVKFNLQEHTVYVRCRPYLKDFMERVSGLFEIIIFTASQSIYAEQLLNVLDPKRKTFRHRVFRESCVFVDGNYLKDLSILGRDLAHVIIVDNSPQAFGFQVDNGIPIDSWFDDRSDKELLLLVPFLESLIGVEDVRPMIARKFNTREKIAAAVYRFQNTNRGKEFERNEAVLSTFNHGWKKNRIFSVDL